MKAEKLCDAIGNIDDELVENADKERGQNKKKNSWIKWTALAACLCLITGAIFGVPALKNKTGDGFEGNLSPSAITNPNNSIKIEPLSFEYNAVYPDVVMCPDENDYINSDGTFRSEEFSNAFKAWRDYENSRPVLQNGYIGEMSGFYRTIVQKLLLDGSGENITCSPSNIYMALSMLAEITDGNSRKQILNLLGAKNVEQLRKWAKEVWESSYENSNNGTLVLGNSFWLSDTYTYKTEPFNVLKNNYYASSFAGEMGSNKLNKRLQVWINEQTGGLLTEQANATETYPSNILALVSTIYFKGQWDEKFMPMNNKKSTFHGTNGDKQCDFMYQKSDECGYLDGDGFKAISKSFIDGSNMYFILPDSGKPEELIKNSKAIDSVLNSNAISSGNVRVNLSMPKFDVTSDIDLRKSFTQLGLTDIMDGSISDFSPISDETGISCSSAKHAARVTVDEEGCKAAAFTIIAADSEAYIELNKEVDFTLDKPFIFAITNKDGLPLFFGIVNNM